MALKEVYPEMAVEDDRVSVSSMRYRFPRPPSAIPSPSSSRASTPPPSSEDEEEGDRPLSFTPKSEDVDEEYEEAILSGKDDVN